MNSAMLLPWVALLTPLTVIAWTLGSQRAHRRWLDRWFGATLLSFAALALLDLLSRHGALDPATLTVATHGCISMSLTSWALKTLSRSSASSRSLTTSARFSSCRLAC